MRRFVATLLVATTMGSALVLPTARADRPKEQQGEDAGPPPEPIPTPTAPPPPPPPATGPTIIVAPTVNAKGEVVVTPPPAPTAGGPVVITPQGVPIMIRNAAPDAAAIEHRLVTVDGTVLGSCMGNCTFQVPPGTYVLESGETDELRSGRQKIVVTGPTMVDVRPGSKSARSTGLALGIAGPVLLFTGLIGTMVVALQRDSADFDCRARDICDQDKPSYTPWVLSMVAGAAGTTVGWIMFAGAGTKMKASGYAPSMALAPIVTPTTTGAALTVTF